MNHRLVLLSVVWVMFVLAACTEDKASELAAPKSSVFVSADVWTAQKGSTEAKGQDGFNMSSNLKKGSHTDKFGVAYSTAQLGNSGWHVFDATSKYMVYSFEYSVPKMKKANGDSTLVFGPAPRARGVASL